MFLMILDKFDDIKKVSSPEKLSAIANMKPPPLSHVVV